MAETKLTPELHSEIIGRIRSGANLEAACESSGITFQTYRNWMRWGGEGNRKEPYRSFFEAVTRARAENELDLLSVAIAGDEQGSQGASASAKWALERTRPQKYAAQLNVKIEQAVELLLSDVDGVCSAKDCGCYEEILSRLASRRAGLPEAGENSGESPAIH